MPENASNIGVIVIGRNEGDRLRRCLTSVVGKGMPVVYVDSASTDGSVVIANEMGAEVVDLDMTLPFSAARARNEGFSRMMRLAPQVKYVQFVDGDCEVAYRWIEKSRPLLDEREDVAIVCGRRRERFPKASIYNRLADVEWNSPLGEAQSCGGDALVRVAAFRKVGGYNGSVVAGEEPELCQRLRADGFKILRIDVEMTLHDSAMLHFNQWWKRSIRSGYGAMDVATRFGSQGLFVKQTRSARWWGQVWTIGLCAVWILAAALAVFRLNGHIVELFALIAVVWTSLLPLQVVRIARGIRIRAGGWFSALAYGIFTMIAKWANLSGQRQYARDRAEGKLARLIDYKAPRGSNSPVKLTTP
jgi:GT2 family glycosyltransferase